MSKSLKLTLTREQQKIISEKLGVKSTEINLKEGMAIVLKYGAKERITAGDMRFPTIVLTAEQQKFLKEKFNSSCETFEITKEMFR